MPYNHLPHTPFKHIGIKPISEAINGVRVEGAVLQPLNGASQQRGFLLPLQQGNPLWPKQTGVARPFIAGEGDVAQLVHEGTMKKSRLYLDKNNEPKLYDELIYSRNRMD